MRLYQGIIVASGLLAGAFMSSKVVADEIHDAASKGDLAKVEALIQQNPQTINLPGRSGKVPLHYAAQGGYTAIIEFLIAKGAKVDALDVAKETPLHFASALGKREAAEALLKHGAQINSLSDQGSSPFDYAVYRQHYDLAKWLIAKGADINHKYPDGSTLLHRVAYQGSVEAIRFLLDSGVPVDIKNTEGARPIHWACTANQLDTVKVLVERGADLKSPDQAGWPPVLMACNSNSVEIVRYLIEQGASVKDKLSNGVTAMHVAANNGGLEMMKLLLKNGAFADAVDALGSTALHTSCERGNSSMVELLVSSGVLLNVKQTDGKTPLILAAKGGYGDIVKLLLSKKVDTKVKDRNGKTALDYAKQAGQTQVALALKRGNGPIKSPKSPMTQPLPNGKAQVIYLGHSGWAVRTKSHFLVFDYYKPGREPDEPGLVCGSINPAELKGTKLVVFASHDHADHYMPIIFDWRKTLPDAKYVMGFKPEGKEGYEFAEPGKKLSFDGVDVYTTTSSDAGVAFFVKVDGVSIYHAGDNTNRKKVIGGEFKTGIDYLAREGGRADLVFAPVSGCGFGDISIVRDGDAYIYSMLQPKMAFPMHAGGFESEYAAYAKEAKGKGVKTPMHCAGFPGDWVLVSL